MEFNEQFLQEMGLSAMPEEQKQKFLDYIQEELEIRIGERISRGLTEEQLNEFDMIEDPAEAAKWLEYGDLESVDWLPADQLLIPKLQEAMAGSH